MTQTLVLTDAETKNDVLVVIGGTGTTLGKPEVDNDGTYTELYNSEGNLIISVLESPREIQRLMEKAQ